MDDLHDALIASRGTVCREGYKVYTQVKPHTMTEVSIDCKDVQTSRVKQISIFAAAVYTLFGEGYRWGQTAMHADVWNIDEHPNILHGTIEIKAQPVPPSAPQRWPADGMTLGVEGRAGEHLRIDRKSRTPPPWAFDKWDRWWFLKSCDQMVQILQAQGDQSATATEIQGILDPQGVIFKFVPVDDEGQGYPSRGLLISAIQTIRSKVVETFGAGLIRFRISNEVGKTQGLGSFDYVTPSNRLGSTTDNSTSILLMESGRNVSSVYNIM